jgi:hypothetical protein
MGKVLLLLGSLIMGVGSILVGFSMMVAKPSTGTSPTPVPTTATPAVVNLIRPEVCRFVADGWTVDAMVYELASKGDHTAEFYEPAVAAAAATC